MSRTLRALVVTLRLPFPPVGGMSLRLWHFIRALATTHRVTVCGFTYGEKIVAPEFPVEIVPVTYSMPPLYAQMQSADPAISRTAYEQLNSAIDEPWFASYFDCPPLGEQLRLLAGRADVAIIGGSSMGRFLPYLPAGLPKLLDFPDVYTAMAQNDPQPPGAYEIERIRRFEGRVATLCSRCVVCSTLERDRARDLLGLTDVEVVSNGTDTCHFRPSTATLQVDNLLFVGAMHYQPNTGAVEHFVRDILPLIHRGHPNACLHVVGDSPPPGIRNLASNAVKVHGFVPDVRPFYQDAAVVVVPLLVGGGTRLKILEAAACGKAIVSTRRGAEGLEFRHDHDILLADTPEAFAGAVRRLQDDADLRRRLGTAARNTAERYDWQSLGEQFVAVTQAVADAAFVHTTSDTTARQP